MTNYPTVQTFSEAAAALGNRDRLKVANNTYLNRRGDDIAVTFHDTDVVTYHPSGSVTLSTGGYQSMTTKERLNRFTHCSVQSVKGRWWVRSPRPYDWSVPFVENMTIHPDYAPEMVDITAEDAANKLMRKAIKRYVEGYTDEEQRSLLASAPTHAIGDCLICQVELGQSKDDPATYYGANASMPLSNQADNSHLLLHVEEGYRMASLMLLAVTAKKRGNPRHCLGYPGIVRDDLGWFLRKRLLTGAVAVR